MIDDSEHDRFYWWRIIHAIEKPPETILKDVKQTVQFDPVTRTHVIGLSCQRDFYRIGVSASYRNHEGIEPIHLKLIRERLEDELREIVTHDMQTRQLRATWSMQAQQDFRAIHNLEAEREIAAMMADEMRNYEPDCPKEVLNWREEGF